jgi:hypothetical protein
MTHNSIVTTQSGGSAVHVARIHHDKVDLKCVLAPLPLKAYTARKDTGSGSGHGMKSPIFEMEVVLPHLHR